MAGRVAQLLLHFRQRRRQALGFAHAEQNCSAGGLQQRLQPLQPRIVQPQVGGGGEFLALARVAVRFQQQAELPAGRLVAPQPRFAFEKVATMTDDQVADGMRTLLKDCARFGASDLHLSTGARPFIRKNRTLSYLSEHVLTASDTLRHSRQAGYSHLIVIEEAHSLPRTTLRRLR